MTRPGYAGRRFVGRRRVIDNRTPGMPAKHEAWPGVQLDESKTHATWSSNQGKFTGTIVRDDR